MTQPAKVQVRWTVKQCKACWKVKRLDDFYRRIAMRDGRENRCKECAKAANRNRKRRASSGIHRANDVPEGR